MANAASKLQPTKRPAATGRRSFEQGPRRDDDSWISTKDMAIIQEIARDRGTSFYTYLKALPKGTRPLRLVGEGAANAVFELKVPDGSPNALDFKGFLLRVAKVAPRQPLTYDYVRQHKFWVSHVQPVLGGNAVSQELVILHKSDIVLHLNNLLRSIDHTRKKKFQGSLVGQTDWGFLVEDMRPEDSESALLFEFKPKWLLQSPSAPRNAIRCRQCAMELYHFVTDPGSYRLLPKDKPCPLALGNGEADIRVASPFRITHLLPQDEPREQYQETLREVANHGAISILRDQQGALDVEGPLRAPDGDWNFGLAMTFRDCTCFAQISRHPEGGPIKIRYGDFDWKDPTVKSSRWREAEQDLIQGGFYTADWILCGQTYYHPPTNCLLEWANRDPSADVEIMRIEDKAGARTRANVRNGQCDKGTKVHTHLTDLKTLRSALADFKRSPRSTSDVPHNPYRSEPPING